MRALLYSAVFFFLLLSCKSPVKPDPFEQREVLAIHQTEARFEGLKYKECRGRTTSCPDKCGKSGEFASFVILKYNNFESFSQYGKKQEKFEVQISDFNSKKLKNAPAIPPNLKKGGRVNLSWKHEYVTKNYSSYPERTITALSEIN